MAKTSVPEGPVLSKDEWVKLRYAAWLPHIEGPGMGLVRYERGVHKLPAGTQLPSSAAVIDAKKARAAVEEETPPPDPDTLHEMTPKTGVAV